MLTLGEQLRKNIEEEKLRQEKAIARKLKKYTDDISKWIQEGKIIPRIWRKDQPKLFEEQSLEFLKKWTGENGMEMMLWTKGWSAEHFFDINPKEL